MNEKDYQPKIQISPDTLLNAWFNTQFEREKQLLTLSSSAIALLVTLLRTVGVSNLLQIVLFGVALIAFLVTVILVLEILSKNAEYIGEVLQQGFETEHKYVFLNRFATISFIIGIIMVVIIGMYSAQISLSEKQTNMNKDNIGNTQLESVQTNKDTLGTGYKLCSEVPKVIETNSPTPPNVSNPSAFSKGSGSDNTSKPDGSS